MSRPEQIKDYSELSGELKKLVDQVRSKDVSLEESLDIFERAIAYATRAVELIDSAEVSPQELASNAQDKEGSLLEPEQSDAEPAEEQQGDDKGHVKHQTEGSKDGAQLQDQQVNK